MLFSYSTGWAKSRAKPEPGSLSPGSVPRGGLVLSTQGRCFSTDGHRCIEPPRYLLGAGRRCCWRPAPLLVAVPLPACKAAFLKIPPAMSSVGARSGHGDVTAKKKRMGASLRDQAKLIPARVGESLQRGGHQHRAPAACTGSHVCPLPATPQTVQQQVGIPWDPQCSLEPNSIAVQGKGAGTWLAVCIQSNPTSGSLESLFLLCWGCQRATLSLPETAQQLGEVGFVMLTGDYLNRAVGTEPFLHLRFCPMLIH